MRDIINFFFETGFLQNLQRSGNNFLGSGNQTVASHVFRVTIIGYTISEILSADTKEVMTMCLFHDIEESRTGDLNYLQQRYVKSDDKKALNDCIKNIPIKNQISKIINEFEQLNSLESKIAKDADTLELILYLKEEFDKGNKEASEWIFYAKKRLITDIAKKMAEEIDNVPYNEWWKKLTNEWDKGTKTW
jgi:putative hydrolase of HD superfamily